ncbi:MAG TPA: DUF72 domain-containing protein, partial [Gemmatimonas sp.]|nr:DUF72 domain-containing protein [Gemmatimonas sp.]
MTTSPEKSRKHAKNDPNKSLVIGTAGWSLPRDAQGAFPEAGTHLQRYAAVLHGVEINSSFYRPHRPATYARWAASVPKGFRFSIKVPRSITHEGKLADRGELLEPFLEQVASLGAALGPLLVQLPPSLQFDSAVAGAFLELLRELHTGDVVLEPRHATWFSPDADVLLQSFAVARVAADPARVPEAAEPGGSLDIVYYRLHGSPVIYRSSYEPAYLQRLAQRLDAWRARGAAQW